MYIGHTTNFNQGKHNHKTILYQKQTFICECGSKIKIASKIEHNKSIKHKKYIEDNKQLQM
jgi:hypothetical protein